MNPLQQYTIKFIKRTDVFFVKRNASVFFLKKATKEPSSRTGKADWLWLGQSASPGRSTEGCKPFVLGTGMQRPVGVKGQGPLAG